MKRSLLLALCMAILAVHDGALHAQVVQLPSVRNFSYTGSAWVPDGGTTSLGGTGYRSSGSVSRGFGPYAPRAAGVQSGGSSVSVTAQIIDLRALDEAILNANVPTNPKQSIVVSANSPAQNGRTYLTGDSLGQPIPREVVPLDPNAYRLALAGHNFAPQPAADVAQIESDIQYYLSQGKIAESAGRLQAARVYYRMAMQSLTPEVKARYNQILEREKLAEQKRKEANRPDRIQF